MNRLGRASLFLAGLVVAATPLAMAAGSSAKRKPLDPAAVQRLAAAGNARVSIHSATGAARFVSLPRGQAGSLSPAAARGAAAEQKALAFFREHGAAFGIKNPATELRLAGSQRDAQGGTHVTHKQMYMGVPVFAGLLRSHFDGRGSLRSANGTFIPNINLDPKPSRSAREAADRALARVSEQKGTVKLSILSNKLYVYREGLARGIEGPTRLAYEVVVGNRGDIKELVYVDAHLGKVFDQVTGIHDAMYRRVYDANYETTNPPQDWVDGFEYWEEGEVPGPPGIDGSTAESTPAPCVTGAGQPDCNTEANNMAQASEETYNIFNNAFGRDSFDAAGAFMDSIFDRGYGCPNASWNGAFISFCAGVTTDDVTGHEWGHAYTQYTHDLIYAWQPGALNEAYSDMWGEAIDLLNGRGTDSPGTNRGDGNCSVYTRTGELNVNSPASIAGIKTAQAASFGPVIVGDTTGDLLYTTPANGCTAISDDLTGKIALIDRGTCTFVLKVTNAQAAGAIGVVVANNVASGLPGMGGQDLTGAITIPSVGISQANGTAIKNELALGAVNGTIRPKSGVTTDDSYRWLMGEDSSAFGGAIRDMWNPTCYTDPAKVSDIYYHCATSDAGGVHTNSGVPNHAFALAIDGGTYNGQTITGIGIHKAGHIYYRAQAYYQTVDSDFSDHADAIEQSCADLTGQTLSELSTGAPTGSTVTITTADCAEVAKAMIAVEMRTPPTQCGFEPLLDPNTPALCSGGTSPYTIFSDDFESGGSGWSVSNVSTETNRDWEISNFLPGGRAGSAFFAIDPTGGTCAPGGDETRVMYLDSPTISIPNGSVPLLSFDHYLATEAGWDGGNLKVDVNGGGFSDTVFTEYSHNPYNVLLFTAGQGNTNPLEGEEAFSGTDGGTVRGSWGTSRFDLFNYAAAGNDARLRFAFGNDGCSGSDGWYVDDVTVYSCLPEVTVSDVTVTEGDSGTLNAAFVVSLGAPSTATVTINYGTAAGTATAGTDYYTRTGSLIFPAGTTSRTLNVSVVGDTDNEGDETFYLNLTGAAGATITDSQGVGTIIDDDGPPPSMVINNVTVVEGNSGLTPAVFTVTLSAATARTVTVNFSTQDVSAKAGQDYQATSGVLTIGPGNTTGTITVNVIGDTRREIHEKYIVNLSGATYATISDSIGVGTITNDEGPGPRRR